MLQPFLWKRMHQSSLGTISSAWSVMKCSRMTAPLQCTTRGHQNLMSRCVQYAVMCLFMIINNHILPKTQVLTFVYEVGTRLNIHNFGSLQKVCTSCQMLLPNQCSFLSHQRTHQQKPPYICPECGASSRSIQFQSHITKNCLHYSRRFGYR